jgi:hypothetical protein
MDKFEQKVSTITQVRFYIVMFGQLPELRRMTSLQAFSQRKR